MVEEEVLEEEVPVLDAGFVKDLVSDVRAALDGPERLVSLVIASQEVVYECKLTQDGQYLLVITNRKFLSDEK